MFSPRFTRSLFPLLLAGLALAAASCQTAPDAGAPTTPPAAPGAQASAPLPSPALATLAFDGSQQAVAELDRHIAAAGRDAVQLSAIAENLVAVLNSADATFAGRQAAAQRLGILVAGPLTPATESSVRATLAAMLRNDLQVELARLALDTVPGPEVDALLVDGLADSSGRRRLALIQSVGSRRIAAAVPRLAPLLDDADPRVVAAATQALADIGGRDAVGALRRASGLDPAARAAAVLAAAQRLEPSAAVAIYTDLFGSGQPRPVQTGALRSLIAADRAGATRRIVETLSQSDWSLKEVALEAVAALPPAEIVPALAAALPSLEPSTQVAVLAALGRHAHPAALPAVSAACTHDDPEIRAAAIDALGYLPGNAATARLLADTIARDSAQARLARQSLTRHDGAGVDATILAGAQQGEPAMRAIYIEQLAPRNMTEAIPALIAMRNDASAPVRQAAAAALGDLGGAAEQAELLDWTISATDAAEQARALRGFVTLTLRLPDNDTRGQPLYAALQQVPPATALRLLPALPRIGGAASASCAARLAVGADPALAEAASNTLARWPDRTALLPLIEVAEKAPLPAQRAAATQNALTWLERNREPWSFALTEVAGRLLEVAPDDAARRRALVILRRGNDDDALALVEKYASHATLADEARETALTIRAHLAGRPDFRASTNEGGLRNLTDNRPRTFWSAPATPEHWLEIDFKAPRPIHQITLNQADRADNFPEAYEVFVTDDLANPGAPRASGAGRLGQTVIDLPPGTTGRYVIVKHTAERKDGDWSIAELYVD